MQVVDMLLLAELWPRLLFTDPDITPLHVPAIRAEAFKLKRRLSLRRFAPVTGSLTIIGYTCSGLSVSTALNTFRAMFPTNAAVRHAGLVRPNALTA